MTALNTHASPIHNVVLRAIGSKTLEQPRWLVKGVLPQSGVALLAGQYAAGKTFVAVDLGLSVCLGQKFLEKRTQAGGVLFAAAEGAGEVELRVEAARAGKFRDGVKGEIPFLVADCPSGVEQQGVFVWLENAIKAAKNDCTKKFGTELRLVVIDTLAAAFGIEDENANAEAARIMRRLADLGNRYDVLITPVTHMGKNADSGVRGASAYGAGADAILSVLATTNPQTGVVSKRSLALTKSRRGSTGPLGAFMLIFKELGLDADRDPIGSCFVEHYANDNVETQKVACSKVPREFRDALDETLNTHGRNHAFPDGFAAKVVEAELVRAEFLRRRVDGNPDPKGVRKRQAWSRAFRSAKEEGLIVGRAINANVEVVWRPH